MTTSVLRELDELRRSFGTSSPYRSPTSKYDKLSESYYSPPSGRIRSYSTALNSAEVSSANLHVHVLVLGGRPTPSSESPSTSLIACDQRHVILQAGCIRSAVHV